MPFHKSRLLQSITSACPFPASYEACSAVCVATTASVAEHHFLYIARSRPSAVDGSAAIASHAGALSWGALSESEGAAAWVALDAVAVCRVVPAGALGLSIGVAITDDEGTAIVAMLTPGNRASDAEASAAASTLASRSPSASVRPSFVACHNCASVGRSEGHGGPAHCSAAPSPTRRQQAFQQGTTASMRLVACFAAGISFAAEALIPPAQRRAHVECRSRGINFHGWSGQQPDMRSGSLGPSSQPVQKGSGPWHAIPVGKRAHTPPRSLATLVCALSSSARAALRTLIASSSEASDHRPPDSAARRARTPSRCALASRYTRASTSVVRSTCTRVASASAISAVAAGDAVLCVAPPASTAAAASRASDSLVAAHICRVYCPSAALSVSPQPIYAQLTLGIDPFSSCLSTLPAELACRLIARASSLERWSFSSKRAVLCALLSSPRTFTATYEGSRIPAIRAMASSDSSKRSTVPITSSSPSIHRRYARPSGVPSGGAKCGQSASRVTPSSVRACRLGCGAHWHSGTCALKKWSNQLSACGSGSRSTVAATTRQPASSSARRAARTSISTSSSAAGRSLRPPPCSSTASRSPCSAFTSPRRAASAASCSLYSVGSHTWSEPSIFAYETRSSRPSCACRCSIARTVVPAAFWMWKNSSTEHCGVGCDSALPLDPGGEEGALLAPRLS
mmetsp:Transcript_21843/g.67514  ORF Transcript_21843/g.67514 Transcript_21843/m.67514 type:complete len:686 (+) Transcript_21843:3624-5681(+)